VSTSESERQELIEAVVVPETWFFRDREAFTGLVRIVHQMGDRRDHFHTTHDVWEMFQIILEGRKRREIDPTLLVLRELMAESSTAGLGAHAQARLGEMLAFFEMTTAWYEQVRKMPKSTLTRFIKMGGRVARLLESA